MRYRAALWALLTVALTTGQEVELNLGTRAHANLVGTGPDTKKPDGIRFKDVIHQRGVPVDLVVVRYSGYGSMYTEKSNASGKEETFGSVNVQCGTRAELMFHFFDAGTSIPIKVDLVYFTFLLLTENELVQVNNVFQYAVAPRSVLNDTVQKDVLQVSLPGIGSEMLSFYAEDPHNLSEEEERHAVTVTFRDVSDFRVGVSMAGPVANLTKRFVFTGIQCLYNCEDGPLQNWPVEKRSWCCKREHRGCPPSQAIIALGADAGGPYDCEAGKQRLDSDWTTEQKQWCCLAKQVGCSATPPPPRLNSSQLYDCQVNGSVHEESWTSPQRAWCCMFRGIACRSFYDCQAGLERWKDWWSLQKQAWCCKNKRVGCDVVSEAPRATSTRAVTLVPLRVATGAGFQESTVYDGSFMSCQANKVGSWPLNKKQECCRKHGIGCSSLFAPYDCKYQSQTSWTKSKIAWCCELEDLGCDAMSPRTSTTYRTLARFLPAAPDTTQTSTSLPNALPKKAVASDPGHKSTDADLYDCLPAPPQSVAAWPTSKASWCCQHTGRGCSTTTIPSAGTTSTGIFDCSYGYATWQYNWSFSKALWCCRNHHRGCPNTDTTAMPYDCNAGLPKDWSNWKIEWCCTHVARGCPNPAKAEPFTCDGNSQGQAHWSPAQQDWCCSHYSKGCSTVAGEKPDHFDCYAGFADWAQLWSAEKAHWCCTREGFGCPETTTTTTQPYNCRIEAGTFSTHWSDGRRAWCCLYEHIGCQPTAPPTTTSASPYNCEAGIFNWETGWVWEKKEWCCLYGTEVVRSLLHEGAGCQSPDAKGVGLATFQKKFKQLPEQVAQNLTKLLAPTLAVLLALVVVIGTIRTCSRGWCIRTGKDFWFRGSRVYHGVACREDAQLEDLSPETAQLLEFSAFTEHPESRWP